MPISGQRPTIDACNCFAVRRAARQISRLYDAHLERVGLRNTQFLILATLGEARTLSVNDFADRLDVERTAMGKMLATLEREGRISVRPRPEDRRSRIVELTPDGQKLLERAIPLWREAQKMFEDANGTDQVDAVRRGFRFTGSSSDDQPLRVQ